MTNRSKITALTAFVSLVAAGIFFLHSGTGENERGAAIQSISPVGVGISLGRPNNAARTVTIVRQQLLLKRLPAGG